MCTDIYYRTMWACTFFRSHEECSYGDWMMVPSMTEIKNNFVYSYTLIIVIRITNDYQPQHACIHHALSHIPFPIPSKTGPSYPLLAQLIILHESVLTPEFLKLLGSMFFGGFAGIGVGDSSLWELSVNFGMI